MISKKINYVDYAGNERSEEHWFHLTKAELIKWVTTSGDYTLDKVLMKLYTEHNGKEIMRRIEELIDLSYGVVSLDGRRFIKSPEALKEFKETEAYSILFSEIATNAEEAAKFINGIMPKELSDAISKEVTANSNGVPDEMRPYFPTSV